MKILEIELQKRESSIGRKLDRSPLLQQLVPNESVPSWFRENGNTLLSMPGAVVPPIDSHPHIAYASGALIVLGNNATVGSFMIWGSGARIILGDDVYLPFSEINCGGDSVIYIGSTTFSGFRANLNARNGGSIHIDGDGLWSEGIRILTDDMHAIRDLATGERLNPFGGSVMVAKHVWLGFEALLLPGADVGSHCVVGARSVVTSRQPSHTVCAGSPARTVREGITWTREDLP